MSARVSLNLLNKFGGEDMVQGFAKHFVISLNLFNKFNNTLARMKDSIYHLTLKSHIICDFLIKMSRFRH